MVRIVWNEDLLGSAQRVVKDNIGMAHGVVRIPMIESDSRARVCPKTARSLLLSEWVFRLGVGGIRGAIDDDLISLYLQVKTVGPLGMAGRTDLLHGD